MDLLTQRNKVLILSEKYGWETAAAYGTDPVASDSEDEKRIKRAHKEVKATKDQKAKLKNLKQKQNFQSKKLIAVHNRVNQSSTLFSMHTNIYGRLRKVGVVESWTILPRLVNPQYQEFWTQTIRRSFPKPICLMTRQNQTVRVMKPVRLLIRL